MTRRRRSRVARPSGGHVPWVISAGSHAFIYANGVTTDIGTLGGNTSVAHAINDSGAGCWDSSTSRRKTHAFLYDNGAMTDLDTLLGGAYSSAAAINDSGEVAGAAAAVNGGEDHAFAKVS